MKIAIFASIWAQNIWDELILKNEIRILEDRYSKALWCSSKDIKFTVFSYDVKNIFYSADNVSYKEYFPIGMKNPRNIFRNIKNFIVFLQTIITSDLIVIGWGGIFYDSELQSVGNPLKQWLFRIKVANFFRKKIEIFRVWINIKVKKNLETIKKIFSKVDIISVRDNQSFWLLTDIWLKNMSIIEDPVFFDNYDSKNISEENYLKNTLDKGLIIDCLQSENLNIDTIKNIIDIKNISWKTFGISLRKLNIDNYFENILEILNYIVDNNWNIIFIPHSFHKKDELANDFIFLNSFYQSLIIKYSDKISVKKVKISICETLQQSYWVYKSKEIDINIAQRLHSIILSQVYWIEFIGVSYSKKTTEVLKTLSKKD